SPVGLNGRVLGMVVLFPVLVLCIMFVLAAKIFFAARHVVLILPFLIVLVIGGTKGDERILAVLLLVFIITNGLALWRWYMVPEYQKGRWKEAVAILDEYKKPGDLAIVMGPSQFFIFDYYERGKIPLYLPDKGWKEDEVISKISGYKRVWIIACVGWQVDPDNRIARIVDERGKVILAYHLENRLDISGGIGILLFDMKDFNVRKDSKD
ncbi:MAG: hypothetical protein J7M18_01555, partial [Candidatus Eremiobacteraeota bacterium]|nr:hypothetical protein [Candidatus Eremiobacteraeota bacterium]